MQTEQEVMVCVEFACPQQPLSGPEASRPRAIPERPNAPIQFDRERVNVRSKAHASGADLRFVDDHVAPLARGHGRKEA